MKQPYDIVVLTELSDSGPVVEMQWKLELEPDRALALIDSIRTDVEAARGEV